MTPNQRTIAKPISFEGVGLHTGQPCRVEFRPAPADSGIRFVRLDLPGAPEIPVSPRYACADTEEMRRTILKSGDAEVHTVEHILAAAAGLEIDNLVIALTSKEPAEPRDGSAAPYVRMFQEAGLVDQHVPRRYFRVSEPVRYEENGVVLVGLPHDGLRITFTIEYDDAYLGTQHATYDIDRDVFIREIAPARTFVLQRDVDALRARGMILGGTLQNAVVVQPTGILNQEPLRFDNEFVRHKILDFIGDLYLLGRPALGHFVSIKSGHATNVRFVQRLAATERPEKAGRAGKGNGARGASGARKSLQLDINAIMKIMPHRYPFLLIDRILSLEENRVVGIKNVTINEPFFVGHFPGHPIMPAVLIIEAMAQCGGVLLLNSSYQPKEKLVYFIGIDRAKFRKPVRPGDQLRFELKLLRLKSRICKMEGKAYVDGDLVAEAELLSSIVDRDS
ncbi:MAG: bifunctional UDP-3-O-[3-hydroxymyristoyl] N-acetylglucosamine deacetylase/3-hydroxyacyl-ACP dehydratase [Candidatus Eisenbacteria bacterium]|uniref:Multifunctional fusion protein n=1 Tax=Eiseniibacteriota bacterium TaxID=2212470 RepID=A0A538TGA1_UNCEI|nr:MAG: bifunctional UDP-3-O-[3-hydroxymyristoyl] N-acetylglucosamine deacetylase/3-hydroxyacyl-ACP dehydratase [Candidatus Eisenbacteria bacterium]